MNMHVDESRGKISALEVDNNTVWGRDCLCNGNDFAFMARYGALSKYSVFKNYVRISKNKIIAHFSDSRLIFESFPENRIIRQTAEKSRLNKIVYFK